MLLPAPSNVEEILVAWHRPGLLLHLTLHLGLGTQLPASCLQVHSQLAQPHKALSATLTMKLTPKLVRTLAPGQDLSKVERIDASKQGVIKVRCTLVCAL